MAKALFQRVKDEKDKALMKAFAMRVIRLYSALP